MIRRSLRTAPRHRSLLHRYGRGYLTAGFSLLETMIVTGLTAVAMVALLSIWRANQRSLQNVSAAASLAKVSEAFESYLRIQAASLGDAGRTKPHNVAFSALRVAGLESAIPEKNSFGQTYELMLRQPVPGEFQAMVTTKEGSMMSPEDVIDVARLAVTRGAAAGYTTSRPPIGAVSNGCPGDASGYSFGAFGDWCILLSTFGMKPGAGHVQSALFYSKAAAQDNDVLYRTANKTVPERNRMRTSIDMDGNDVTKARSLTFGNGMTSISGDASGAMNFAVKGTPRIQLGSSGSLELKPGSLIEAPAGGNVVGIAGNWISGDANGLTLRAAKEGGTVSIVGPRGSSRANLAVNGDIQGAGALAVGDIASAGKINASGSITSAGRIRAGEFLHVEGRAVADDPCAQDGTIGFDASKRGLVHCLAGRWAAIAPAHTKIRRVMVTGDASRSDWFGSTAFCPSGTVAVSAGYSRARNDRLYAAPQDSHVTMNRNRVEIFSRTPGYRAEAVCLSLE